MPKDLNKNKFADVVLNLDFDILLQEANGIESLALAHVPNPQIFEGEVGDLKSISIEGPSFEELLNLAKSIELKIKSPGSDSTKKSTSKKPIISIPKGKDISPISILKTKKENKNQNILEEFTKEQKNLSNEVKKLNTEIPLEVQFASSGQPVTLLHHSSKTGQYSDSSEKKNTPPISIFSLTKTSPTTQSSIEPDLRKESKGEDIFKQLDNTLEQSAKFVPVNIFASAKPSKKAKVSRSKKVSQVVSSKKTKKSITSRPGVQEVEPKQQVFEQKSKQAMEQEEISNTEQDFTSISPTIKPKPTSSRGSIQDQNIFEKETSSHKANQSSKPNQQEFVNLTSSQSNQNELKEQNQQKEVLNDQKSGLVLNSSLARRLGFDLSKSNLAQSVSSAKETSISQSIPQSSKKEKMPSETDAKLKNISLQAQKLLQSKSKEEQDINMPDEAYLAYAKENIRWLYEIYKMGGISFDDFKKKVKEKMHSTYKSDPDVPTPEQNSSDLPKQKHKKFKK